ncbi:hypothetical protein [Anabaena azotica]|uniref:Rho termination factor N-terminal domain-containing protein n=1 Tax=Anabaena azotica FACHB-119 TaxID=947527 RepID=A0ABR8DCK1_9NOST|nr:hypothetical protein [Anabaena azotica]MBD2503947.1 hypothetical protein [Anabaena azotica FACHB-119]
MFSSKFRQSNFPAIEALQKGLKSYVSELEKIEKEKNTTVIKGAALMVTKLVKNALVSVNHLVRINLDNEKSIDLLKLAINSLHTAYLKIYRYENYISKKIKELWQEAFNILPSGAVVQPELFGLNEVGCALEAKIPVFECLVQWMNRNIQEFVDYKRQRKTQNNSGVQLCLDLENAKDLQHNNYHQNVEVQQSNLISVEDIKNLTLRAARKVASELGLPQKSNGKDLSKAALIDCLLNWRQQKICTA